MKLNPDDYEVLFSKSVDQHYFAFNKKISDEIVHAHQEALEKVKKNSILILNIYERYMN
ncbi:MAG: hypothetical protein ACKOAD_00035 [Gammaproteobacteria bacterium]